jgi:hypothetical protein
MKIAALIASSLAILTALGNAEPRAADIRVSVSAKSTGTERPNKSTTVSNRILKISVENRDHAAINGLEVHWMMIARDINSRKLSIAAEGTDKVSIDRVSDRGDRKLHCFLHQEGGRRETNREREEQAHHRRPGYRHPLRRLPRPGPPQRQNRRPGRHQRNGRSIRRLSRPRSIAPSVIGRIP